MFLIGVALVYGLLLANLLAPSRARLDALEHAVRRLLRPRAKQYVSWVIRSVA